MAFRLDQLARVCGARLEGDGAIHVRGPATLELAGPDEISFLANPRYSGQLRTTNAAAVVVANDFVVEREGLALLRTDDPSRCFSRVVEAFAAERPSLPVGVHPRAHVAADVQIGAGVAIGPNATIESGAVLGDGVVVWSGAYVGVGSRIGARSVLWPGATVLDGVTIGERCVLHAGCVVGADGFGFEPTPRGWIKIPQCGTVVLEDDVELGANATVDRGRFGATRIGRGSKLDNLVHIAHNVQVGPDCVMAAQAGIAGSAQLARGVVVGGQVGIGGHVKIASGVRLAGQSGAYGDIAEAGDYLDSPARPKREVLRRMAAAGRSEELRRRVRELEERLAALEGRTT
jgi:UDP-3-O-[3-hydroxymyristoyl] glucosamine N-acyltransferase